MMNKISVLSPCKINSFLHIIGKREDGFHNLQSRFCLLNYGDNLHFEIIDDNQALIHIEPDMGFALEENLIYKAAKIIQNLSKLKFSLKVKVDKNIPMGGGLGGGSSNAATTLLVLNHLLKLNLSLEQLQNLGAQLGSDVPFFIIGQEAIVEGRGEIIKPDFTQVKYYVVVTPKIHVSTKEIFSILAKNGKYSAPLSEIELKNYHKLSNDCIDIVRKKYCEIGHTLDSLIKYGSASMSGTGASCFCVFNTYDEANKAYNAIQAELKPILNIGFTCFLASSIERSPVISALH